jgi:hypothetical protein
MKKRLWNKRIPSILAFIILAIGIWVTSVLVQTGIIFVGRATPDKTPQNISISNISETSFTVSFTTTEKSLAALSVEGGNSTAPFVVFDDRNKSGQQTEFFSHIITVSDLIPKTTYSFTILSDGDVFMDGDKKFTVTTGPPISESPPRQNPITGRVLLPDGDPGEDSIVELTIAEGQKITVATKTDGIFIIPTNSIRNSSLDNYLIIPPNQEINITVLRQDLKSTLKTLFSESESIPPITLRRAYDFTAVQEEEASTLSSQLRAPTPETRFGEVKITVPRASESFVDDRPLFRGTAVANQKIKITIESELITAEITSDSNGAWSFRPATPLPPGEHKITIETVDRFGILRSISQTFVIFASGSQVSQSATPSATPTITVVPSIQAPTPTVSIAPPISVTQTPNPTVAPTSAPTTIPTVSPTIVASVSPTFIPTTAPVITPAPPGANTSIVLTFISVLLIFAGSTLLFLL